MTHREITDDDLAKLVERVREATGALMQGDIHRYLGLVTMRPTSRSCPRPAVRRGTDSTPLLPASKRWRRPSPAGETATSSLSSSTRQATSRSSWGWSASMARSPACPTRIGPSRDAGLPARGLRLATGAPTR
jgi:hypothetical protein